MSTTTLSASRAGGIALRPLHPVFGAEVLGVALGAPGDAPLPDLLHDLLMEHGLLLLRGQSSLPERLARDLAALEARLLDQALHQGAPRLPLSVRAVPDLPPPGWAERPFWHADRSYAAHPALACFVRAEAPAGTIAFADQRQALAALPAALRARLDGLRGVHESPLDPSLRAEHPLVRRHPVTGEASLYANPAFTTRILNLPAAESGRLLKLIFAATTEESATWRHDWRAGDVLIWDNRRLLHTEGHGPALEALRIEGDQPTGAADFDMPWVMAG